MAPFFSNWTLNNLKNEKDTSQNVTSVPDRGQTRGVAWWESQAVWQRPAYSLTARHAMEAEQKMSFCRYVLSVAHYQGEKEEN